MQTLQRNPHPIRMRNYGRIIQDLITYTCTLPEGDRRNALTLYIAQCMRQKNIAWNKDADASAARIKRDIDILSNGQLKCEIDDFEDITNKKKKKN